MDFVETIFSSWQVVLFISGAIFNLGYTWSVKENLIQDVEMIKTELKNTQTDFSEIKGDIKSINTKLDLLINKKIK